MRDIKSPNLEEKGVKSVINNVSGLEVMLVLLNGSILLTVLLSLVFSIQYDLNYLESVAEVYNFLIIYLTVVYSDAYTDCLKNYIPTFL